MVCTALTLYALIADPDNSRDLLRSLRSVQCVLPQRYTCQQKRDHQNSSKQVVSPSGEGCCLQWFSNSGSYQRGSGHTRVSVQTLEAWYRGYCIKALCFLSILLYKLLFINPFTESSSEPPVLSSLLLPGRETWEQSNKPSQFCLF